MPEPPVPALDCNCSVCRMTGLLHIMVPHDQFELISGHDALSGCRVRTGAAEHLFCGQCGVKSFSASLVLDAWSVNAKLPPPAC